MPIPPARLAALRRRVLAWWGAGHRALPWRFAPGSAVPYRVWLSEVMLQQTRVEAVIPYYRRFLERWPSLEALAAAPDDEVFREWSGLGYYARCRNLLAAARTARARHGGLPATLPELRSLPGFGPYTAGAVASIAFGIPAAAVDGNVARVLARVFAVRGDAASPRHRERLWTIARALVGEAPGSSRPRDRAPVDPGEWNQALMELGATLCARAPACGRCPVAGLCRARAGGLQTAIPAPRRRPRRAALTLACAVVRRRGRVLLVRRPGRGLFAGLLAFPAAEVVDGDEPEAALRRALARLGLRVRPGAEIARVERTLTHRDLRIQAFACDLAAELRPASERRGRCLRWLSLDDLPRAGLPSAMAALLPLAFSARVV